MTGFERVFPGGRQLRQRDLERLPDEDLRAIRDEALARFNQDIDGPHAGYLEEVGGAAADLLLDRNRGEVAG